MLFNAGAGAEYPAAPYKPLHAVKGVNIGYFELHRLSPGKAHCQQREAVTGEKIGGAFFALSIRRGNGLKIQPVKSISVLCLVKRCSKPLYCLYHILVLLPELLRHSSACGYGYPVPLGYHR